MWDAGNIVAVAAGALRAEHDRLCAEQAVHNIDALEEVEVHPLLARGFAEAGFGVLREQPYPAQWRAKPGRRRVLPEQTERQRCDLVLTPEPGQVLADSLIETRAVETDRRLASGTLFAPVVEQIAAQGLTQPEPGKAKRKRAAAGPAATEPAGAERNVIAADTAYWLEVKLVGQFCYTAGVPGPNPAYATELVRGIGTDIRKLAADPEILRSGVLLLLPCAQSETAEADLVELTRRCLARGVPLRLPLTEGFGITERIGNRWFACAVFEPVRGVIDEAG